MKIQYRLTVFLILALAGAFPRAGAQDIASKYAATITPEDLKRHLLVIAADSLEGRDTGSPGQKKAAAYVAGFYREYGLQPAVQAGDGTRSYFQHYNLYRAGWGDVYMKSGSRTFRLNEDFYINGLLNVKEEEKVELVLAGYGIVTDKYDDYAYLDVRGKAVALFDGEPVAADGKYILSGNEEKSARWGGALGWRAKVNAAMEKGARFVVIISSKNGDEFERELKQRSLMMNRYNNMLSLQPVREQLTSSAAVYVSERTGIALLNTRLRKLEKVKSHIARTGSGSKERLAAEIALKAARINQVVETENVAAFLEGTDKKDEVIVISAHLDHIGISPDGQINNGADDDGSGTVSLLELAEAFAKAKREGHGPRRSLLFLNVTGEEKGLLGSEYYSEHPLFPLKNTVANLNIDMIGRVDDAHKSDHRYVYLIGSDKLSSELHAISEEANKKYVNYTLDYTFNDPRDPNKFYYRSDHYNFAKKGIPVIFYFTGVHEDYHRPGDDVEKILFDKQAPIVRLVFHTAWELANREERIRVDSNKP